MEAGDQGRSAEGLGADEVLGAALDWVRQGRKVAVATVVETWGSAPRRPGGRMLVDSDGNFVGSVSGGCVENAVILEAADVIRDGRPKVLRFGVADEDAWEVGLACGGKMAVLVEPVTE